MPVTIPARPARARHPGPGRWLLIVQLADGPLGVRGYEVEADRGDLAALLDDPWFGCAASTGRVLDPAGLLAAVARDRHLADRIANDRFCA